MSGGGGFIGRGLIRLRVGWCLRGLNNSSRGKGWCVLNEMRAVVLTFVSAADIMVVILDVVCGDGRGRKIGVDDHVVDLLHDHVDVVVVIQQVCPHIVHLHHETLPVIPVVTDGDQQVTGRGFVFYKAVCV
eukprot:GHVL01023265.1.p2 GENE.GHVL01023265.1~~GHVL01023265.1.p2  ORF type:complete len:131 (-),score=10.47 GHVL01023265.1:176-568(-)